MGTTALRTSNATRLAEEVAATISTSTEIPYAVFDGVTSKVTLPKTYKLASNGDYIEFVAKVMEIQSIGGSVLGMIGAAGTNQDYVGPSSTAGSFALRDHTGANQNLAIGTAGYSGYDWHRYRVTQTSSILWTIAVDGVDIGTLVRGTELWINCIGQGYSTTYCTHAMKELTISTATTGSLKITNFRDDLAAKKLTYTSGVTFQSFYYDTGDLIAVGNHVSLDYIDVYVPQENSTKYIQYRYQNTVDGSKAADVWRIKSAYIATPIEAPLIWGSPRIITTSSGEWENAVRITADDDFFGGSTHGKDEKIAGTNTMKIDGVGQTLTTFIAGAGSNITFTQSSNCYKKVSADYRSVNVAQSDRTWVFTAENFELYNTLTWKTVETLTSCYLSMAPILRSDVTSNLTEWGLWGEAPITPVDISAAGFTVVEATASEIAMFGDSAGLHVKTKVNNGWGKSGAISWISNDAAYNKIYNDFTGAAYVTSIGETLRSNTTYTLTLNT